MSNNEGNKREKKTIKNVAVIDTYREMKDRYGGGIDVEPRLFDESKNSKSKILVAPRVFFYAHVIIPGVKKGQGIYLIER